jgi:bifunctional non-homologous end joining protein LigD
VSARAVTGNGSVAGAFVVRNAHEIWWLEEGITKLDVAEHYARVAPRLLPWTADRPLTVERHDLHAILSLVNLGALSLHLMNCRTSTLDRPDWLAFDLGPPARFTDAVRAAMLVPLRPGPTHAEVQAAARAIAERLVAMAPDLVTQSFYRRERGGRVYVDIARNVFGATVVAPYSVRHRPHAPVSTPFGWKDVRPDLDPAALNVRTTPERLTRADPWRTF